MPRSTIPSQDSRELRDLVERARARDREAFDRLVRLHVGAVYPLLHRLVGNHEDAEDLTQECFARAWSSLRWFRGEGPFAAWLQRIALHLARDHFRSRQHRPRLLGDAAAPQGLDALAGGRERTPGETLGRRELDLRLDEALQRLPERLRVALVLRVFEGLDYDEIARVGGVTPATARTHVMQARRQLLRWLGPWLEGGKR